MSCVTLSAPGLVLTSVKSQDGTWSNPTLGGPAEDLPAIDDAEFSDNLDQTGLDAYRLARRLGWSHDDALDIVQDASLRAWRYRHTRRGLFRPWFLAIVYREAHRGRRRWLTVPAFWREDPSEHPSDPTLSGDLGGCIAMLPGRQRVALWLRFGADLPFPEIGRVMGISERAAIQFVWRARQALRRTLVGIGDGEP